MTKQKQRLLKAKIAAALYHEEGRVPTPEEIEKWTKFAKVLYTAVLGLHFERQTQKKNGQMAIFLTMEQGTKNSTTDRAVERTVAKMQEVLKRKDVREISLDFAERGTQCTIMVNTTTYDYWLPGWFSFAAFSKAIEKLLTRAGVKAEHHETP